MKDSTGYSAQIDVIEEGMWIPLSSGHKLAAKVWLPKTAAERPVPVLLEFLPYRKRDLTRARDEPIHRYFAVHGYASVRVDLRGTGDSFGIMHDEYESQELRDAKEVIAWLANQDWSSGRVGMFGISWGGFNTLQVAALQPPALRAVIASCFTDDRYTDDLHYMGGCLLLDQLDWGTLFLSLLAMPGDRTVMGDSWRDNWSKRLEAVRPPIERWMEHPNRDEYWKHGSICENYAAIKCPVFVVSGWMDGYSNAVLRILENLNVPRIGIIGPHAHQFGFEERPPGPAFGFLQEALRWWDHWLEDKNTGIMDEPMLRSYVGQDIPARAAYSKWPGRWTSERIWPSDNLSTQTLRLNADGLAADPVLGLPLAHYSLQTVGLAGGKWCPYGTGAGGADFPDDQRLDDAFSLTFDSEILNEDIEILGAPVLQLELSIDHPQAFIAARLNDVKPAGDVARVSFGILNLAHRNSNERPEALRPDQRYRIRLPLNDIAYRFLTGHRIRVSLSTTYFPMVWPSPVPVTLSVFPGSSQLDLPVRLNSENGAADISLPAPTAASPPDIETLIPSPQQKVVTWDPNARRVVISAHRGSGYYRFVDSGIETGRNMHEHFVICQNDPVSALAEFRFDARTGRAGSIVDVSAQSRLSADKGHFRLESQLIVREHGEEYFVRNWDRRFARGLL